MRLILEGIIKSDRHMPDGQMHSFFQLSFNTEKIDIN